VEDRFPGTSQGDLLDDKAAPLDEQQAALVAGQAALVPEGQASVPEAPPPLTVDPSPTGTAPAAASQDAPGTAASPPAVPGAQAPTAPADSQPAPPAARAAPAGQPFEDQGHAQPTIYDVARAAGVSIASVSRVLNGRRNPLPDTKERVLRAVAELGFIPDGAARALSGRLKEVVGVVIRRPTVTMTDGGIFEDEEMSLQFTDLISRGIEVAAQRRDFNLLVSSVDVRGHDDSRRIFALARKSDGLILHDSVMEPAQLERLSRQVPVVTLAGVVTETTVNVSGDNATGMRELARHLVRDHGYRTLAYLGSHADSPDNLARQAAFAEQVKADGASFAGGMRLQGNYTAAGGARVIERLLAEGTPVPDAIACANDQTALGVIYALGRHGIDVPGEVAVTGFDDIPVARHLRPPLTTVRQPIQDLGATAFDTLYSMITDAGQSRYDVILPTRLIRRESCGCPRQTATPAIRRAEGG
jgi:LacI family transcriptional regulator, galactose operon repressor